MDLIVVIVFSVISIAGGIVAGYTTITAILEFSSWKAKTPKKVLDIDEVNIIEKGGKEHKISIHKKLSEVELRETFYQELNKITQETQTDEQEAR